MSPTALVRAEPFPEQGCCTQQQGYLPSPRPGLDQYAWKVKNLNPCAPFDFWFMLLAFRTGAAYVVEQIIALEDGGIRVRTMMGREALTSVQEVRTLEAEHGAYGVVHLARAQAKLLYQAMSRRIYRLEFSATLLDRRLRPIRALPLESFQPPPFPGELRPPSRSASPGSGSRGALPAGAPRLSLRFPRWETDDDGEAWLDCDAAELSETGQAPASRSLPPARPPGLYLDVFEQSGEPSLVVTTYTDVRAGRGPELLFGTMCSEVRFHQVREHIRRRTRSSWFRRKVKLRAVRVELTHSRAVCQDLPV